MIPRIQKLSIGKTGVFRLGIFVFMPQSISNIKFRYKKYPENGGIENGSYCRC